MCQQHLIQYSINTFSEPADLVMGVAGIPARSVRVKHTLHRSQSISHHFKVYQSISIGPVLLLTC